MEEARKTIVELPLALLISAFIAMASAIVAMAVYFAVTKKADRKEAKDNFLLLTDVLLKNSESNMALSNSNTALSNSIEKSKDNQERIAQETNKLFMSLTEKIIQIKNGRH